MVNSHCESDAAMLVNNSLEILETAIDHHIKHVSQLAIELGV